MNGHDNPDVLADAADPGDRADHGGDAELDPRGAAELMALTRAHVERELRVRMWPTYLAWGLAWVLGFGALWLSVCGQHPYSGPTGPAFTVLGVLDAAAVVVTVRTIMTATRGVRGVSETQGIIFGLSWPVGIILAFALVGALATHGASDAVSGIAGGAAAPMVVSIIYVVGSAIWLNRSMLVLGIWLGLITAVGAFLGPVELVLLEAVAGGGGFLVAAAYRPDRA